jgi:hypothetical protein
MGQVRWTGAANSNNAASTYLIQAGIKNSQINNYQTQLDQQNGKVIPGLGQSALSPTCSQSTQKTVNAISGFISNILSHGSRL